MSGTSADGIDAALVEVQQGQPHFLHGLDLPYPNQFRQRLLTLAHAEQFDVDALYALDAELGDLLAEAVLQLLEVTGTPAERIRAIGSHGHTIRHRPQSSARFTVQIGDANRIAQRCGITTIADFRRRDMAAGGDGAPLAPAMHQHCLNSSQEHRAVLNLGGIANLSVLADDGQVIGFDTGPANCLLDAWAEQHLGTRCDQGGGWAASGSVDETLLVKLLADDYFQRPAPKSTGREHFHLSWLAEKMADETRNPADVQATLLALTVRSVADAVHRYAQNCQRLLVCGGGVHNHALMQMFSSTLTGIKVQSTAAVGWDPDWIEATCFAWLASRTLAGLPGNLPSVTGASAPVILGAIYPV
jgi:anhydro-N-acetylmuramic acid kinase